MRNTRNTVPMSFAACAFAQILSTADSNSFPRESRVHRYTRSQDFVGGTNTIFFFPPYLLAQLITSVLPRGKYCIF